MKFEKIRPRGNQEMEKIHIEHPCEIFILSDPNHRPVIRIVKASGQHGTETRPQPTTDFNPMV